MLSPVLMIMRFRGLDGAVSPPGRAQQLTYWQLSSDNGACFGRLLKVYLSEKLWTTLIF